LVAGNNPDPSVILAAGFVLLFLISCHFWLDGVESAILAVGFVLKKSPILGSVLMRHT
jgi:hypothetical protein